MKKSLLTISAALVATFASQAQIPNSGFEQWDAMDGYENPTDWATINGAIPGGEYFPCTKSDDHYPENVGSYSMRLETDLEWMQGGWGMSVTDTFAYPFEPAFAIQGNPTSLHGYYKFESEMGDQAWVKLILFFEGAIVADGDFISPAASTNDWEAFVVDIPAYAEADSATLLIFNYLPMSETDGPNGNSVLWVDNLNFNSLISGVSTVATPSEFAMYPNPTTGQVTVKFNGINTSSSTLVVYNVLGEVVLSQALQQQRQLDIAGLSNGIYTIEFRSSEGFTQQKLIVQH
jgi:hypothetical protein